MSVVISRVGTLLASYGIKNIRVERIGYLSVFSFKADGVPFRFELLDRGQDAVFVLPVDWTRRVLYLVSQPRLIKVLSSEMGRSVLKAASQSRPELSLDVAGAAVHTVDAPAGMIDEGETSEEAGCREVEEETGFTVSCDALTWVATHFVSMGSSTEKHICYFAAVNADTPRVLPAGDGHERIETLEVTFDEAYAMLADGSCEHATLNVLLSAVEKNDLRAQLAGAVKK